MPFTRTQPRKMSLTVCMSRWPDDDPLAAVVELAGPGELLQHRRPGLFRLQEQRVLLVVAEQQRHPGARADAAHADHLAGEVDQAVLVEQDPPLRLEARAVRASMSRSLCSRRGALAR